jgi:Cu2+-containing amine oxidase
MIVEHKFTGIINHEKHLEVDHKASYAKHVEEVVVANCFRSGPHV